MPLLIDGQTYQSSQEVIDHLGISRQTLWRWRQQGHVPHGHRFRDGRICFTANEVEAISAHANKVVPLAVDECMETQPKG